MTHISVSDHGVITLDGQWTHQHGSTIRSELNTLEAPVADQVTVDAAALSKLDTSGALLLMHYIQRLKSVGKQINFQNFQDDFSKVFFSTEHEYEPILEQKPPKEKNALLSSIGRSAVEKAQQTVLFINFVGHVSSIFSQVLSLKRRLHWKGVLNSIDDAGYQGLPIIALLMFLVGIVLAYQLGMQLQSYGASVFIVNLTGLAVLREFGPLIAAIIASGRTSSSYTAQIGLMKVNEELDALKVMGLSPINRIALPKILGVVIALPLVTIWADAFGVIGSMVMSQIKFGINMSDFLQRFDDVTELSSLWTGLMKAPFFGVIIASVGCFKGFRVQYTAESIGTETTKSVVQAIFLVIVADALFSVFFSWAGI